LNTQRRYTGDGLRR